MVGVVVVVIVLVVFRQRLFVRDPLATVERNGARQAEYRVYLNYFNDILVEDVAGNRRFLVQAKDGTPMVPGFPLHLQCVTGTACLTDSDLAPTQPLGGSGYTGMVDMTSSHITFVDGDGAAMRVELR